MRHLDALLARYLSRRGFFVAPLSVPVIIDAEDAAERRRVLRGVSAAAKQSGHAMRYQISAEPGQVHHFDWRGF